MCRTFPSTLEGAAQDWLVEVPSNSIPSFQVMADLFLRSFANYSKQQKTPSTLLRVKHQEGESLQTYLDRFIEEEANVADLLPRMAVTMIIEGLRDSPFRFLLTLESPRNMTDLMTHVQKYINFDEIHAGWEMEARQQENLNRNDRRDPRGAHRGDRCDPP
ncbi:hypothetical protein J5N97_022549 [Dioscorea zingiberensis]|uniref:Retrotransposon gag domain-containing protein n=1 Tax=Dioscorea zingiberensis TaxID=325984 RepID=A0A9D5CBS7_9LILI|nr:hypothetical protein J5N97_022549 [Dioscorea zingiberensis]